MQQPFSLDSAGENRFPFSRSASMRRRARRASGFTLIEIAVSLAIFVIGALAIIRIFPSALAVVQTSETRAIGTRLAQATLARFDSQPFTIPEAIYDFDSAFVNATTNPAGFSDFEGAFVGSATRNASLPRESARLDLDDLPVSTLSYAGNQRAVSQTALGRFRRISGEQQRVRVNANGPYVVTRFPFVQNASASVNAFRYREVEGVRIDNSVTNGTLDFTDATINDTPVSEAAPNNNRIDTAYRSPAQVFYVSYRYTDGAGRIRGVVDEPITFPSTWDPATSGRVLQSFAGNQVVEGPVKIRYREPVATGTVATSDAIVGFVRFSPSVVQANEKISLDYVVADWRWLVSDETPVSKSEAEVDTPYEAPRIVALPTRHLLDEPLPPTSTNPYQLPLYALMLGVETNGVQQAELFGQWNGQFPDAQVVTDVEQKSGRVSLDIDPDLQPAPAAKDPFVATRVRVVYRNLDGWGHQLSVAAQSYVPFEPAATAAYGVEHPRQPWREYYYEGTSNKRFLFFHPSEAGKSVKVSFEYEQPTGSFHRVTDAVVTISDTLVDRASVPAAFAPPNSFFLNANTASGTLPPTKVAIAELANAEGMLIGGDVSLTDNNATKQALARVTAITAVRGASVQARTAWFEGGRYSQAAVSGFRSID